MGSQPLVLVCGATGALGSRIAQGLASNDVPVRALVRPASSADPLTQGGIVVTRGDLRDRASLEHAVDGVGTLISTVNTMSRRFAGERSLDMQAVDREGYASLIEAAEKAGVARFVYLSFGGPALLADSPFSNAKRENEERLRHSPVHEVIVRPDAYQELWFSAETGFTPEKGRVLIFGKGRSHVSYVSRDDVAQAVIALATMEDPPHLVELGGPEAITRIEAVEASEAAFGKRVKTRHIPRAAMWIGSRLLKRARPEMASSMAMGLEMDRNDSSLGPETFHELGIDPKPVRQYIAEMAKRR